MTKLFRKHKGGLTPWIRVLRKLTVPGIVKILPAFYGTQTFITLFPTARDCIINNQLDARITAY